MDLLLAFVAWVFSAMFVALIAASKRRSVFGWFALGFLFGPFALVAALVVPQLGTSRNE
jgi:hypothetical protein